MKGYREAGLASDNPLQEMKDVLDSLFGDVKINSDATMVSGADLCEMLGLFHDLAEAVTTVNVHQIAELEKYKIAYTNRLRRDKKRE